MLVAGCAKENDSPSQSAAPSEGKAITDKGDQELIDETIKKLPSIAIYNETMDQYVLLDLSNAKDGFNFASPGGGISFSGPGGSIQFVQGPDGNYFQVVTPGSSGGGGAGGVVTAGSATLDVSYVFCFNSGDPAPGTDLFGFDGAFSGFSGAVGIAGDFEALESGEIDENANPFDFFQGFVEYLVFEGSPNGSYDVIDFFEAEEDSDEDFLNGNALAVFVSFQEGGGIYFSTDGEVTFSGNSVAFEGTYWGLTDFIFDFDDDVEDDSDDDYVEVNGFGALTCL